MRPMKVMNPNEERIHYPITNVIRDIWRAGPEFHASIIWGTIIRAVGDIAGLFPSLAFSYIVSEIAKVSGINSKTIVLFLVVWFITMSIRYLSQYFSKKMIFQTAVDVWLKTEKKMIAVLFSFVVFNLNCMFIFIEL